MKSKNLALAIVLWACIPFSLVISSILSYIVISGYCDVFMGYIIFITIPVLFFIFGLIALITGREQPQTQQKAQVHNKVSRKCPKCNREIPFDAKICPYCENKFDEIKKEAE